MQQTCFGKMQELALGSAEGLGLRLAKCWNERVSHCDGSKTGECIRNVRNGKDQGNSVSRGNRVKGLRDEMRRKFECLERKKEKMMERKRGTWTRVKKKGFM